MIERAILSTFTALIACAVVATGHEAHAQTPAACPPAAAPDHIRVTVTGLRNNRGIVGVALYGPQSRWPRPHAFLADCQARIENGQASCLLNGVHPGGFFAIAVTHDENNNGHFDQGLFGIPLEGYGFSNDRHPVLSAPSFDACRFFYRGGEMTVRIAAQY